MNRRQLLTLSGACLAGLAGCLSQPATSGEDPEEPTDDTQTDAPTTSSTTPPESPTPSPNDPPSKNGVVVEDIIVRKAITYESYMGSGGVLTAEGTQYVVASVRTDRTELPEFSFVTDEESWNPGLSETVGANNYAIAGHEGGSVDRSYNRQDSSFLAFEVPSPLSASNARIRLGGTEGPEWPLPPAATARLPAPAPNFELTGLTVPDAVSQGDPLSISLTVTNRSETDGRFLAAVYWPTDFIADDDESHSIERTVAAGEDMTATLDLDTEYTATESGPVTLSVAGHVTAERTVQLENVSTPT